MKILAIETSCDETACAIVEDGRCVLANVVDSQIDLHRQYGGVIPELAAREHLDMAAPVVEEALKQANLSLGDIDAFAATLGPGLVGALLVGVQSAKTLAFMTGKPFIGVNHLQGHIASNYLESKLAPPFICLLVSGGHTQLLKVTAPQQIELLGETLDDAVGEAFDKVARLMGLPYPGGPQVDKLAKQATGQFKFDLPVAKTQGEFDFSFSGLKTAVSRQIEKLQQEFADEPTQLQTAYADLANAFQKIVVKALSHRVLKAVATFEMNTVVIAGGVAANTELRSYFENWQASAPEINQFYSPQFVYCTDNAAMIASAAYFSPFTYALDADVFSREAVYK